MDFIRANKIKSWLVSIGLILVPIGIYLIINFSNWTPEGYGRPWGVFAVFAAMIILVIGAVLPINTLSMVNGKVCLLSSSGEFWGKMIRLSSITKIEIEGVEQNSSGGGKLLFDLVVFLLELLFPEVNKKDYIVFSNENGQTFLAPARRTKKRMLKLEKVITETQKINPHLVLGYELKKRLLAKSS